MGPKTSPPPGGGLGGKCTGAQGKEKGDLKGGKGKGKAEIFARLGDGIPPKPLRST